MTKTQPTQSPVADFIAAIEDERQRKDTERLCRLMTKITGKAPVMWGPSIVGFDSYHYKYESGREGDMAAVGFSPRKQNLVVYLVDGAHNYPEQLERLGPHKTGKACLYIKHLNDVNIDVLEDIIRRSHQYIMTRKNDMHRAM